MFLVFLFLFAASFLAGVVLTWLVRNAAQQMGFVDAPGKRKLHKEPVPLGGGIAIYLGLLFMVASGVVFVLCLKMGWIESGPWLPEFVTISTGGILAKSMELLALMIGGLVILLVGVVDDLHGLSPRVKLAIEILVALGLYALLPELRITFFVHVQWIWCALTVLWIVGLMNAFNFLDNMDGLCAGLAAITALVFFVLALESVPQQQFVATFMLVFAGVLFGFLVFNFPPAKIYLGDAGSLLAGYILAVSTILFTFYQHNAKIMAPLFVLAVPLQIMAIPIFDAAMVIWIRVRARKPIYQGDTNHISHRLVGLGMTKREAVLCVYLIALFIGFATTLALQVDTMGLIVILIMTVVVLMLVTLLEQAGRRRKR